MKRLILIKQSPAIQLGHLYEHIFAAQLYIFLYEHHLFSFLDYHLEGKTYYGGIVYIDIELYTDAAIALSDEILALPITINEETITVAATQILAEKEEPLASTGYEAVKRGLEDLHAQPWQNIDDVEIIDTKDIRKKTGPFYISEGKARPARKLTTSVLLNPEFAKSHRELFPLFRQFSWLITASLCGVLADTYGYYSLDDAHKNTRDTIGFINIFKVGNASDIAVDVKETLDTCLEVVHDLQHYDAFKRFMDDLRDVSHYDRSDVAPNIERNYEDTLIFIGPKGWKKTATDENYKLLLKHMSIEVKFGREKKRESISS